MPTAERFLPGSAILAAVAAWGLPPAAVAQQPAAQPLPASAVMARGVGDGWHSQGGVAGPWWGGGANVSGAPAADGGFWFGWPGLGFGGVQGSSRSVGATTAAVTTMPGAAGTISSGRLVPFVTGVVPVVGDGFATTTAVTARPILPPAGGWQPTPGPAPRAMSSTAGGPPAARLRTSSPGSRERARAAVASGDRRLLASGDDPAAARAAVADYRTAARLADDDADIHVRLAIVHEALGQRDLSDRAVARAVLVDGRLAADEREASPELDVFGAASAPPFPAVATRGLVILDAIAAGGGGRPGELGDAVRWLRQAWAARWSPAVTGSAPEERTGR